MERLQSILQLLTRPIEFASRDAYAHLSTVKDLGPFVSRQVVQALAETVYPARVETDLLALRQLLPGPNVLNLGVAQTDLSTMVERIEQ